MAPGVASASVLLALGTTIIGATLSMGVTLFTIVVPNEVRGLCLSISAATNSLFGVALAPVFVSVLSGLIGGPSMIGTALTLVCVTASLFGAATFAFGRRCFPRTAI